MAERLDATALEARLGRLGDEIAWPEPGASLAARVTARVAAAPSPTAPPAWRLFGRPVRRSLVVAVALLLVLAAVAAAVGLGLRGLRIVFVPPGSPVPTVDGPRAGLLAGLGTSVPADEAAAIVGFEPVRPAALGEPSATFVADRRLTLVWPADADRPPIAGSELGVLLTQFRGDVDRGWYEKVIDSGAASVEAVTVGGRPGWWISGRPHQLVYREPNGAFVEETRRTVGDVLVWEAGELTLRLETALGREATIRLAETVAPTR
jgi:hypothetical protein